MALLHDDVMDADDERAASHRSSRRRRGGRAAAGEPSGGVADCDRWRATCAAFAEQLFSTAGVLARSAGRRAARSPRMRLELALGAYLAWRTSRRPATVAYLKGGAYTVEGPALFGAALAGAPARREEALRAFRAPRWGAAFQMLDDLADGDAAPRTRGSRPPALVTPEPRSPTTSGTGAPPTRRAVATLVVVVSGPGWDDAGGRG
jgi:hypothetical protein